MKFSSQLKQMIPAEHHDLLTVPEVAARLRLRQSTIRKWLQRRKISYVKLGRKTFVRSTDLKQFIEANVVPAKAKEKTDR